jgi:hypothetical protein
MLRTPLHLVFLGTFEALYLLSPPSLDGVIHCGKNSATPPPPESSILALAWAAPARVRGILSVMAIFRQQSGLGFDRTVSVMATHPPTVSQRNFFNGPTPPSFLPASLALFCLN